MSMNLDQFMSFFQRVWDKGSRNPRVRFIQQIDDPEHEIIEKEFEVKIVSYHTESDEWIVRLREIKMEKE